MAGAWRPAALSLLWVGCLACNQLSGLDDLAFLGGAGGGGLAGGSAMGGAGGAGGAGGGAGGGAAGGAGGGGGTGGSAPKTYVESVLGDGPVSYWRLGETQGSTAANAINGGPEGTYVGGVTHGETGAIAGDLNTSVRLDGSTGEVVIGDVYDFSGNVAFSIECWFRAATIGGANQRLVNKEDINAAVDQGWDLSFSNQSDGLRFERHLDGGTESAWLTPPATGVWIHVVATYDGSQSCIYANAGTPACTPAPTALPDTPAPLTIGNRSGDTRHLDGWIDEVAIYDHALTATQVAAHHAAAQ